MALIGCPTARMPVHYPHEREPRAHTPDPGPGCATGKRAKAPQPRTTMIERLHRGDGPRLRALRVRALEESPDAFGSTLEMALGTSDADWEEGVANLPTFVWRENDADAGMAREAPHTEDEHASYLISLWVAPEVRGRGVGTALVKAVIACARHRSRAILLLDVALHNLAARRLYQRLGFRATGRRSRLPAPRDHVEELEMALALTNAEREFRTEGALGRCEDERGSRAP